MADPTVISGVRQKYQALSPFLNERARRCWAACEALALGRGGISAVAAATELSRPTIRRGIVELRSGDRGLGDAPPDRPRIRRPGGGRCSIAAGDRTLLRDLRRLIEPATRCGPMSPLLWTCKSTRDLAGALADWGHDLSHQTVGRLLVDLGYSLRTNRKTQEGTYRADRDAQFAHINRKVRSFHRRGQPVVSVDVRKKEIVGDSKDPVREREPRRRPRRVKSKDSPDEEKGEVAPYRVYDQTTDEGWVDVAISRDTAEFAVDSIRRWWSRMGQPVYRGAKELLISADSGGSDGGRDRLWKIGLHDLADETGLKIAMCHLPPGTSKWNRIEHRLSCHITEDWRDRPRADHAVVVNLIGSGRTRTDLRVEAESDPIADEERIERDEFRGDWNYSIEPHPRQHS